MTSSAGNALESSPASNRLPLRKRLVLLAALSGVGGALFVPFTAGPHASMETWAVFALGSAVVGALCAWGGLIAADRARLPMPILRAWEMGERVHGSDILRVVAFAVPVGVAAAAFALAGTILLDVPRNPGTLAVRLLTIPFAAVVTEILAHLFVLGVLYLWWKKGWLALLVSSLIFVVVFHGQSLGSWQVTLFALATNFVFFMLTGWGYLRYGVVCAILTHAVAHAIVLGIN